MPTRYRTHRQLRQRHTHSHRGKVEERGGVVRRNSISYFDVVSSRPSSLRQCRRSSETTRMIHGRREMKRRWQNKKQSHAFVTKSSRGVERPGARRTASFEQASYPIREQFPCFFLRFGRANDLLKRHVRSIADGRRKGDGKGKRSTMRL